jgi:multicomponent Na+:H+ antiporter subunit D
MAEMLPVFAVFLPLLAGVLVFLLGPGPGNLWALCAIVMSAVPSLLLVQQVAAMGTIEHFLGGWAPPLGIRLMADGLSAVMILLTAVVGVLVSLHALGHFAGREAAARHFWVLWPLLWGSLNALFLSADLFNAYVTLELVTLAAIPLVLLAGSAQAVTAALRYLILALFGSMLYLAGVALVYGLIGTLDMQLAGERLAGQGWPVDLAAALMVTGLLVKAAIVPFHIWLPDAHGGAPAPVSALLSALVVKAAVYLLLRLWSGPLFEPLSQPAVAWVLAGLGVAAILFGSVQALRQQRLKLVVAYSTVAQLGYMLLLFPLAGLAAWQGVIYHGVAHGVAKAALFLAAGNILYQLGHDRIVDLRGSGTVLAISFASFAIAGVSIMGLPPSGGFLAKWLLLQATLQAGAWWLALVLLAGGLLAAGYVFRVLRAAFQLPDQDAEGELPDVRHIGPLMRWPVLALALLAIALGFAGEPLLALLGDMPGRAA